VLCPTDCVSHAAYYKLKQHCKRTGKPCLLFKGAGVSGFAVALARLSAGQRQHRNDPRHELKVSLRRTARNLSGCDYTGRRRATKNS